MNDYTPDTTTVKWRYLLDRISNGSGTKLTEKEAEAEFDRWLETFREEAFYEGYNVGYSYATGGSDDW